MGSNLKIRIALDALIFLSIATLPWWFTTILVIVGLFRFSNFYEVFIVGVVMDSLYGAPRQMFFGWQSVSLLMMIVLFIGISWLKTRLRI